MTLRASGFVVLSSSAADGRVPALVLLLFFWSRALKSSFLLEDFPVLTTAAGDSLVGEPDVFTGEWELGRLPKVSPGSFRPRTFLLDLWMTVKRSSVVRAATKTSSSSSAMESAVLSLAKLFSSVPASDKLPCSKGVSAACAVPGTSVGVGSSVSGWQQLGSVSSVMMGLGVGAGSPAPPPCCTGAGASGR